MATKSLCSGCLRALHQQVRRNLRAPHPLTRQRPSSIGRNVILSQVRSYAAHVAPAVDPAQVAEEVPPTKNSRVEPRPSEKDIKATEEDITKLFKQYDAIPSTEALFKECASQADYIIPQAFERKGKVPKSATGEDIGEGSGWWYETLKLVPTFNMWAQVTFLHMYLLTVRFRYFSEENSRKWQQHLHDHFFWEAEHRMNIFHGMSQRSLRHRNLKELYNQWRGVIGAYDEGLIRGDAVLATAIWRNIFKADEQADWRDVALITSFMRRGLKALDGAPDKTLLSASVRFGSPTSETALILKPSNGLNKAFDKGDEEDLKTLMDGNPIVEE